MTWMICDLLRCISVAVVNPVGTNLVASAAILSALASLMPLIARRFFFGAKKKCPKGKLAQAFLTSFAKNSRVRFEFKTRQIMKLQ